MLNADPILPSPLVWNPPLLYPRYSYQMHFTRFSSFVGAKMDRQSEGCLFLQNMLVLDWPSQPYFQNEDYGNGGEMFPIS